MQVLLIDDNKEITQALAKYLTLTNFDVLVANNGNEGLELIYTKKPEVVLLDISMPEFSGLDVLEELQKKDSIKNQKIIVLTASAQDSMLIKKWIDLGVTAFVNKPVQMQNLINIINKE